MKFYRNYKKYIHNNRLKLHRPIFKLSLLVGLVITLVGVVVATNHKIGFSQITKKTKGTSTTKSSGGLASEQQAATAKPEIVTPTKETAKKALPNSGAKKAPSPLKIIGPVHSDIITTIFWAGETASADNGGISNVPSAWDEQWATHAPAENPYYFALPYNDFAENGSRKSSASQCSNLTGNKFADYSWCKNAWISIKHGAKVAYAQWQDVGPFEEDDVAYVFGNAKPKNTQDSKAGLDVSPAVRSYLGLEDVDKCTWSFVAGGSVPDGPWTKTITTNKGGWN